MKTHKNKYFQGYKKLKNIKMFEDFEVNEFDLKDDQEDFQEEPEHGDDENYWEIALKNGKVLVVDIDSGKGMAGEPMDMVYLKVDGEIVKHDDVKDLIKDPEQAQELDNYLADVAAGNEASAKSWTE
jgi:hypothetical protein